jgi:hypothetical protein
MKVTLSAVVQATGRSPIVVVYTSEFTARIYIERRDIRVTLFKREGVDEWVGVLKYCSCWETEHDFTWVCHGHLNDVCELIRIQSKDMLPPGAGYPATDAFTARQHKLRGQLETATLVALSSVLLQVHDAG